MCQGLAPLGVADLGCCTVRPLSFETMLTDPLIRLVMEADGVTLADLASVMAVAREAMAARDRVPVRPALSLHSATCGRA